jgi:adenylate cyclase class IV
VAVELELKAVVADVAAVRASLAAHGANRIRSGRMTDVRYDREGVLAARGEVLRVRTYDPVTGPPEGRLAWKGPASQDEAGLRVREEHEVRFPGRSLPAAAVVEALGYRPVAVIDRWVEYWQLDDATARLEWYPRMDVLCEVEGTPEGIARAIAATGITREAFRPDAIADFVARFEARSGSPAALSLAELDGSAPSWEAT